MEVRGECRACRFAKDYPTPSGEEPSIPERRKVRWWEYFGPLSPPHDWAWEFAIGRRAKWRALQRRHLEDVTCQRFPDHEQRGKSDWCGEFQPRTPTHKAPEHE